MSTVARVLILITYARGCSLRPPKGWTVGDIGLDSDNGRLPAGSVRLGLLNWNGDGTFRREAQVIVDFATGAVAPHDDTLEFMSQMDDFSTDTALGALEAGGRANVSWGAGGIRGGGYGATGNGTFSLRSDAAGPSMWWYSESLATLFAVYEKNDANRSLALAACSITTGACTYGPAPANSGYAYAWVSPTSSYSGVRAWDDERLVGLPLVCCVCISFEYYTYELLADGTPALREVPALNALGAIVYDPSSNEVWEASGSTSDEYEDALTLQRYNYATHQAASVALPGTRVRAAVGDSGGGGLATGVVVLIVVVAVLVVAVLGTGVALRARRNRRLRSPFREGKTESVAASSIQVAN